MRLILAALVALFVSVPAAQAQVTFTGAPTGPTNVFTFDVADPPPPPTITAPVEGAVLRQTSVTLSGTTAAGTTVAIFDGANKLGDATIDGETWSYEATSLDQGAHSFTAVASDTAPSAARAVTVDSLAPPAPAIVTPAEGAALKQTTFTITGTAAGDTTAVEIFEGETPRGIATLQGATWFLDDTLAAGTHTLTAVARDAAGNTATSPARTFTIDTTAPAVAITAPEEGFAGKVRTVTLSGTVEPGAKVTVFDGETRLGDAAGDTIWTFEAKDLADGGHTLRAVASDAAGNTAEAVRHVTIDTVAPQITFSGVPTSPTNEFTFNIGFLASEDVVFDCVHVFPDGAEDTFSMCPEPFPMRELAEGKHELRVTATDFAGNVTEKTATVIIDLTPPDAAVPAQTGIAEFTFAGEDGARYECRLAGPSGDSGFGACGSPKAYSDLAPGDYTFSLQTIDAAGNRAATATTTVFTIPEATPEPTPPAVLAPAIVPTPAPSVVVAPSAELARSLVARTVSGKVLVRRPATAAPADLGTVAGIPVGTEIDARHGRVRLTAAARPGKAAQRAEFFGGVFVVTQASDDVVDISLSEPFGSCAKKTGTRMRKLWGDGKGRFRTHGLNAVVTVRGTRWLVQDSCEGTLTRVTQGLVSVRDTVARKTVLVRAGRRYLAAPKKRR